LQRIECDELVYYRSGLLEDVRHGIFTRHGGVSAGPFDSLNLGGNVGDDPNSVRTNHLRMYAALGVSDNCACTVWQVHSADIIIAHRPWDYHPDHRYTGVLVQDAAYMVTVPFFCPDTPPLKKNPVFLYSSDRFQKPYPFVADIAVAIDPVFEKKVDALMALESQTCEGGALGSEERMADVPPASQPDLRRAWLRERWDRRAGGEAIRYRDALIRWYGGERGKQVKYAEAFEICEYGRQPNDREIRELFPFFDAQE